MLRDRARLADYLLDHPGMVPNTPAAMRVLNFFEMMGFYVGKNFIEDDAVWVAFSDMVNVYWDECRSSIRTTRQAEATYYENLVSLHACIDKIDQRRKVKALTRAQVVEILKFERSLAEPQQAGAPLPAPQRPLPKGRGSKPRKSG